MKLRKVGTNGHACSCTFRSHFTRSTRLHQTPQCTRSIPTSTHRIGPAPLIIYFSLKMGSRPELKVWLRFLALSILKCRNANSNRSTTKADLFASSALCRRSRTRRSESSIVATGTPLTALMLISLHELSTRPRLSSEPLAAATMACRRSR